MRAHSKRSATPPSQRTQAPESSSAGYVTALRTRLLRKSVTTLTASETPSAASAIFVWTGAPAHCSKNYRNMQLSFSELMKYSSPSWICRRVIRCASNQVPLDEPRSSMNQA